MNKKNREDLQWIKGALEGISCAVSKENYELSVILSGMARRLFAILESENEQGEQEQLVETLGVVYNAAGVALAGEEKHE